MAASHNVALHGNTRALILQIDLICTDDRQFCWRVDIIERYLLLEGFQRAEMKHIHIKHDCEDQRGEALDALRAWAKVLSEPVDPDDRLRGIERNVGRPPRLFILGHGYVKVKEPLEMYPRKVFAGSQTWDTSSAEGAAAQFVKQLTGYFGAKKLVVPRMACGLTALDLIDALVPAGLIVYVYNFFCSSFDFKTIMDLWDCVNPMAGPYSRWPKLLVKWSSVQLTDLAEETGSCEFITFLARPHPELRTYASAVRPPKTGSDPPPRPTKPQKEMASDHFYASLRRRADAPADARASDLVRAASVAKMVANSPSSNLAEYLTQSLIDPRGKSVHIDPLELYRALHETAPFRRDFKEGNAVAAARQQWMSDDTRDIRNGLTIEADKRMKVVLQTCYDKCKGGEAWCDLVRGGDARLREANTEAAAAGGAGGEASAGLCAEGKLNLALIDKLFQDAGMQLAFFARRLGVDLPTTSPTVTGAPATLA